MKQKMKESIAEMVNEYRGEAMTGRLVSVRSKIKNLMDSYDQQVCVIRENKEQFSTKGIDEQKALLANETQNSLLEILESIGGPALSGSEFIEKITSGILDGCQAAELTTEQTVNLVKGFGNALGGKALIQDHTTMAWDIVEDGLKLIMSSSLDGLKGKQLKCLSKFAETLRKRVNESVAGVRVGDNIEHLFNMYQTEQKLTKF